MHAPIWAHSLLHSFSSLPALAPAPCPCVWRPPCFLRASLPAPAATPLPASFCPHRHQTNQVRAWRGRLGLLAAPGAQWQPPGLSNHSPNLPPNPPTPCTSRLPPWHVRPSSSACPSWPWPAGPSPLLVVKRSSLIGPRASSVSGALPLGQQLLAAGAAAAPAAAAAGGAGSTLPLPYRRRGRRRSGEPARRPPPGRRPPTPLACPAPSRPAAAFYGGAPDRMNPDDPSYGTKEVGGGGAADSRAPLLCCAALRWAAAALLRRGAALPCCARPS